MVFARVAAAAASGSVMEAKRAVKLAGKTNVAIRHVDISDCAAPQPYSTVSVGENNGFSLKFSAKENVAPLDEAARPRPGNTGLKVLTLKGALSTSTIGGVGGIGWVGEIHDNNKTRE